MFTFKVVNDSELMEKVFSFRYEVAHDELNRINENREKKDVDVYDRYAVHFVAFDKKGKICATTRFIVNSPIGYPTENNMQFDLDIKNRDEFAEISRIFIAKDVRGMKTTKLIMDNFKELIYHYIKLHNIKFMYGALEPSFLKLLQVLKINYKAIGEGADYSGFRYPCILRSEDLVRDNPWLLEIHELV